MIKIRHLELYLGAAVVFIILLAAIFLKRFYSLPYRKANSLMTNAERAFFELLLDMKLGNDIYIFSKVRIADVIYLPEGIRNRNKYLNKIISKHIDFLICRRSSFSPLLAIELDDSSHNLESNRKRDLEKNKILYSANIPLLRVKSRRKFDSYELKKSILKYIN